VHSKGFTGLQNVFTGDLKRGFTGGENSRVAITRVAERRYQI
jgi:hypothetical protein